MDSVAPGLSIQRLPVALDADGQHDRGDESELATATIDVTNDAPSAEGEEYYTFNDTQLSVSAEEGVLANEEDLEGDPLTAVLVMQAQHGTVSLNADGSFTYDADEGFYGEDIFQYRVDDPYDQGAIATVALAVRELAIERFEVNDDVKPEPDWYDTTGDTRTAWVGEKIQLRAAIKGGGMPGVTYAWTIPGEVVGGYNVVWNAMDPANTSASVDPVSAAEKQQVEVTYYWVDGGNGRQVSVEATSGQQTSTKQMTFNVNRPTVNVTTETSQINLLEDAAGNDGVQFGNELADPPVTGIKFTNDAPVGYDMQWVQVSTALAYRDPGEFGSPERQSGTGLDTKYPYSDNDKTANDAPKQLLYRGSRFVQRRDDHTMYLMFKPPGVEGIHVPLRKVEWWWEFSASSADGLVWTLDTQGFDDSAPVDTTEFPVWEGNAFIGVEWESDD